MNLLPEATKLFMYQREGLNKDLDTFTYLESVIPFDAWQFVKNDCLFVPPFC